MGIQITLVQNGLYLQMALTIFLLQPYLKSAKVWIIRKYNFLHQTTVIRHILIGIYIMVIVMMLDSTYRWNRNDSEILNYQNEKNFYLCIFTLFLTLVIKKLCSLLESTFKTDQINKQTIKQYGNSRIFVSSLIEEHNSEKQKLEDEIKTLKDKLDEFENKNKADYKDDRKDNLSDGKQPENSNTYSDDLDAWEDEFEQKKDSFNPVTESKFEFQNKADIKKSFTFLEKGN